MNNNNWIDIKSKVPPSNTDILVYDKSSLSIRIMSYKLENDESEMTNEDDEIVNWFDDNGYYDDSEPEIIYWQDLPKTPSK